MEGGREDGALRVSSCCVCVQVCVYVCVYVYSIFKKLQYMCLFIRLLNEPVWACAPNFLALAVSPELSSFVWFSVCTYACLCLHFFKRALSHLHIL